VDIVARLIPENIPKAQHSFEHSNRKREIQTANRLHAHAKDIGERRAI